MSLVEWFNVFEMCNGFSSCFIISDIVGESDCCCVWFCLVIIFEILKWISVMIVIIIIVNNINIFLCSVWNVFIDCVCFFVWLNLI